VRLSGLAHDRASLIALKGRFVLLCRCSKRGVVMPSEAKAILLFVTAILLCKFLQMVCNVADRLGGFEHVLVRNRGAADLLNSVFLFRRFCRLLSVRVGND
jgi:hypothetical protein